MQERHLQEQHAYADQSAEIAQLKEANRELVEALKEACAAIKQAGEYMQRIAAQEYKFDAAYYASADEVLLIEKYENIIAKAEENKHD